MEVTDQANAAYNADSAPFVETISTAAGMDLAATPGHARHVLVPLGG